MAVFYPTTQLIEELYSIIDGIPSRYDQNFIENLWGRQKPLSTAQYNILLDLYNKYILVPSGPSQILRDYNYA